MKISLLIFFLTSLLIQSVTVAHSDSERILPLEYELTYFQILKSTPARERVRRTQLVLDHFNVPEVYSHELRPSEIFGSIQNLKTSPESQNQLKFFDPTGLLKTVLKFTSNRALFDFSSQDNSEFQWSSPLPSQSSPPQKPKSWVGLRIGIDPGHMAGQEWDRLTGKFVRDQNGRTLSEGLLNLQVALLLKKRFEQRGAIVRLTTSGPRPATKVDYKTFELDPYARFEIRESVIEPWFLKLIQEKTSDSEMLRRFENSPQVKQLFSNSSRRDFFIKRVDLWERARILNEFKPDLVLVIHFDATASKDYESTEPNPQAPNETKSFIFGSYESGEASSFVSASYLAKRILYKDDFQNSFNLSQSIVKRLSQNLKLSLDTSNPINGQLIQPGIRSRNLTVPRYLQTSSVAYLETFFYNRPDEFRALLRQDHVMAIEGVNYSYSNRLIEVANAVELGVADFLR